MKDLNIIEVSSKNAPIIEIDSDVNAVYIRFSKNKVAKTIDDSQSGYIATVDIDRNNNVIGVELIGVKKFSIYIAKNILSKLKIKNLPNLETAEIKAFAAA